MYMNISTAIMTISVGADKSLVPRKILSGIFYAKFLCLLSGQTMFFLIFRIKADDVVMRLNLIKRLIFMKESVSFPTFRIKCKRITVYTIQIIFFTKKHIPIIIKNWFLRIFIMLENQIAFSFSIVGILACNMFQDCHISFLLCYFYYLH